MIKIIKKSKFLRYYIWMPVARKIRLKNIPMLLKCIAMIGIFPLVLFRYLTFFIDISDKEENNFQDKFAIVAIIKNEGAYIKEWIDYHKLIGISKFYIYNNESTDNVQEILRPYIERGEVEYIEYPGKKMQCFAYNDAIERHKFDVKYIAAIDLDEFIFPRINGRMDSICNIIENNEHCGGIGIHWCCFGSSGHKKKPNGFVIENYIYRAPDDFENHIAVKTIFNPRKVIVMSNPHYPCYRHGYYSVDERGNKIYGPCDTEITYNLIRINHYFCKSQDECRKKFARGKADIAGKNTWDKFLEYDRNEIHDVEIIEMLKRLREKM